ncbi:MAG: hypothetical protein KAH18_02470 [Psychromonas sp.]|nr:hypothetical protein [Psychromonas sp.]
MKQSISSFGKINIKAEISTNSCAGKLKNIISDLKEKLAGCGYINDRIGIIDRPAIIDDRTELVIGR